MVSVMRVAEGDHLVYGVGHSTKVLAQDHIVVAGDLGADGEVGVARGDLIETGADLFLLDADNGATPGMPVK